MYKSILILIIFFSIFSSSNAQTNELRKERLSEVKEARQENREQFQNQVEAVKEKVQLKKEEVKEVRQERKELRKNFLYERFLILSKRLDIIENKIETRINKMKDSGIDVSKEEQSFNSLKGERLIIKTEIEKLKNQSLTIEEQKPIVTVLKQKIKTYQQNLLGLIKDLKNK
jgi:hypothetical protein